MEKSEVELFAGTIEEKEKGASQEQAESRRTAVSDTVKKADMDEEEWQSKSGRKGRRKKEKHLTGSLTAKIVAFFLLGISFLVGTAAVILSFYLADTGVYTFTGRNEFLADVLYTESKRIVQETFEYLEQGREKEAASFCEDTNIDIEIIGTDEGNQETIIWSTGKNYGADISMMIYSQSNSIQKDVELNGYTLKAGTYYWVHVKIDPEFHKDDPLRKLAEIATVVYNSRFLVILAAAAAILLFLLCFIFLMCSAGHRNGQKGITPSVLTAIHLDVLTAVFGVAASFFGFIWWEFMHSARRYGEDYVFFCLLAVGGMILVIWCTIYFMELALRMKQGKCLQHTLIYVVLRWLGRLLSACGKGLRLLLNQMPLILTTLGVYLFLCFVEFCVLSEYARFYSNGAMLWLFGKIVVLALVLYIVLLFRKLLEGSRALTEGNEDYRVDTRGMFGGFKEHGENLNSLGQGISKAVAERMKSEHLKTELITNVSHDIKTPLTSIINYADLLYSEATNPSEEDAVARNAKIEEYAQVLLRQSKRMKKLLEDLVEASKATTGNLEVNLEPCEVGVLLSQAVGEYQQKMEEKKLELIARQSQEPVKILADGRHLWRVFDNLMNNICKYAQECTRVYLSMEVKEERIQIIFRNMSKYPLDILPEELEERFVRGDKSRHMEGNGLGLSIAKSLVELQHGHMEIVTDGDLFKVILSFAVYKDDQKGVFSLTKRGNSETGSP